MAVGCFFKGLKRAERSWWFNIKAFQISRALGIGLSADVCSGCSNSPQHNYTPVRSVRMSILIRRLWFFIRVHSASALSRCYMSLFLLYLSHYFNLFAMVWYAKCLFFILTHYFSISESLWLIKKKTFIFNMIIILYTLIKVLKIGHNVQC